MNYICDFHIHSKYSRATSKDTDIDNLTKWAQIKGVNILGTGDFTHPLWLKELKEKLEPAEPGLFKYKEKKVKNNNGFLIHKSNQSEMRFILTTEISSIYSKGGKTRKIHNIVFAPSFETVEKINTHLGWIGNLRSDGRPILGLDSKELAKIVLNISSDCLIIPAHAWTPWFSIFGSNSGFDSIEECFEEYSKYIYSIETGLSSDPEMNWQWSALDNITLISNSDAHSPAKIAREANIFKGKEIDYNLIKEAIKLGPRINSSASLQLTKTIEFFPEEGKYHWDGHRNCELCLSPEESAKYNNICPRCGRPLTIGVMNRVQRLADRKPGEKSRKIIPFQRLIPLSEIIADILGVGAGTKGVEEYYKGLIRAFGNEFKVLLEAKIKEIAAVSLPEIAEGIEIVRQEKVSLQPGYDGEFGKISIFGKGEEKVNAKGGQETLF
jgi:uncharacterized protein (TIGR00375 family)